MRDRYPVGAVGILQSNATIQTGDQSGPALENLNTLLVVQLVLLLRA